MDNYDFYPYIDFNQARDAYLDDTNIGEFNELDYWQGLQHGTLCQTGNEDLGNQQADPSLQIQENSAKFACFPWAVEGDSLRDSQEHQISSSFHWDSRQDGGLVPTLLHQSDNHSGFHVNDPTRPSPRPSYTEDVEMESPDHRDDITHAFSQEDLERRPWTYAVDVWPAEDRTSHGYVLNHILALQENLAKKKVGYDFAFVNSCDNPTVYHRRYTLHPRYRNDERVRLDFLQVFNSNRAYNQKVPNYRIKMAVVFEPRQFHHSDNYTTIADLEHDGTEANDTVSFNDHDVGNLGSYNPPGAPAFPSPDPHHELEFGPSTPQEAVAGLPSPKDEQEIHTPQRSKPIPKPDREVIKNLEGKYCCTWPNCTEDIKEFKRKCEWSKHMDKHDRPYKCPAEGCEKLPGFTYSGGLLRHEREVHGKHGGPKNPLNCPHAFCKRHRGKGFSRLENLNEHLRRVHTSSHAATVSGDEGHDDNSMIDGDQLAALTMPGILTGLPAMLPTAPTAPSVVIGEKRKLEEDDIDDLRGEVKRLKEDKDLLNQKLEAQNRQSIAMMAEMRSMEATIRELRSQMADLPPESLLVDTPQSFDS